MFITKNKVRMYDTDMAGRLYFTKQFRFAHDALEDFLESEGFSFTHVFQKEQFDFAIVHTEADYFDILYVGDKLLSHVSVEKIGTTSFTIHYAFYRENKLMGTAKTVHVTLVRKTGKKISIPSHLLTKLQKHFNPNPIRRP